MKELFINNTNIILENAKDTPRCAIYLYLASNKPIPFFGAHILLGNLLLQGTKTKSAETIAQELENEGIEVSIESKSDYLKVAIVCLNEDLNKALDVVSDFMKNSTFDSFEKEVFKFKNETIASLDSPTTKACEKFLRELFINHKYGITNSKVLETIDNLKKEHVTEYYNDLMNGKKLISIAADIKNENDFIDKITEKLDFMKSIKKVEPINDRISSFKSNLFKIEKNDAKQAQIFQGWITEGIESKDCATLAVLNNILGANGLSSRLFVVLRDKMGLAYTVRSSYKTMKDGAYFMLYIGCDPNNIKKSLNGFKSEIQRLIDEPPTQEEIQGAILNYIGKYKYLHTQTNSQIASTAGYSSIIGKEIDFSEKLLNKIKNVTSKDITESVKKYLINEPLTVVLAPKEYLNF